MDQRREILNLGQFAEFEFVQMEAPDQEIQNQTLLESPEGSYASDLGEFQLVHPIIEPEIVDPTPDAVTCTPGDVSISYQLIKSGTIRGKVTLTDSFGYQYTLKSRIERQISWRCARRSKNVACNERVTQSLDGTFTRGGLHICHPKMNSGISLEIRRDVKQEAMKRPNASGLTIGEELLIKSFNPQELDLHPNVPKLQNLAEQANYKRRKTRPTEPEDLDFQLLKDFIPTNFLQRDLRIEGARHLIFSTQNMLHLLKRAKKLYQDGTFRLVKKPFQQLYSIHAFVKSVNTLKQVPLVFVLMSKKRSVDYECVLRAVMELLTELNVQRIVADFELAVWQATKVVFPNVAMKGCLFHFTQCIFRKIQELGIQNAYMNDPGTNLICRKLMSLPLLPTSTSIQCSFL